MKDTYRYDPDHHMMIQRYVQIAKELCYSEAVIRKIKNAKDETEISRIMKDARTGGKKRHA